MGRIKGDANLIRAMRDLGSAPTGTTLDKICKASLEPMRDDTVRGAKALRQSGRSPKGGHLDQGVVIAKVASTGRSHRVFWLSFTKRARKLAHLVEFGTAPHWQPKRFGGIMHPGARPKPFARPAFEANKESAIASFGKAVWEAMASRIR